MTLLVWAFTPHHTTTVLRPFFRDHPGEPVPEENFWTLWCKGRLTEADTLTIWLGATPSGLTSAHLHPWGWWRWHLHSHVIHIPWTNPTQHSKLHLSWFSRFRTAQGRQSIYIAMCVKTRLMRDKKLIVLQLCL